MLSLSWPFTFGNNADYLVAFWTMILSFATVILAATVPIAIFSTAREEMNQKSEEARIARDFKVEERDKFYAQLDSIYLDIQKTIIKYPHLAKLGIERTENELIQYNAFAFLMWNFIESIHDYCLDQDDLHDTWHCVLQVEANHFADWFRADDNRRRFKGKFIRYIDENVLSHAA